MRTLDYEDIGLIHFQVVDASGGSHGIRSKSRLKSTVATQTQAIFGKDIYVGAWQKAAALARGIICDHPFIDGNKRTGIMVALIFLSLNAIDLKVSDKELEDFAVEVAVKNLNVTQISKWLQAHGKN